MGKSTKYGNWNVGDPADDDARMIHYAKRQIGKFLNRFPEPTRMDVAQHVTRFIQANLPPIMVAKMSDVMRAAETAETVELRKFYVLRLLQMMSSGRPHQVVQRLKQPYAPRPAEEKSAKAAAVVAAAKAVGTKRELPPYNPPRFVQHGVGLSVRPVVSKLVVQIRASMQRGYVNIETAERLKDYLYSNSIDIPGLGTASLIARDIYSTLAKQPGEQMKEVSESLNGYIQLRLQQIVKAIQAIS